MPRSGKPEWGFFIGRARHSVRAALIGRVPLRPTHSLGGQRTDRPTQDGIVIIFWFGRARQSPARRRPTADKSSDFMTFSGGQRIARPTFAVFVSPADFIIIWSWTCPSAKSCRTPSRNGCPREAGFSSPSNVCRRERINSAGLTVGKKVGRSVL
jgi:hypothetical protein